MVPLGVLRLSGGASEAGDGVKIGLGFKHHSFYHYTSESTAARGLGRAWLRQGHEVYFINRPGVKMPMDRSNNRFMIENADLLPFVVSSNSPRLDGLDMVFELYDYHRSSGSAFPYTRPIAYRSGAFVWALSPLSPLATRSVAKNRNPLFVTGSQSYREALDMGLDAHLYTVGVDTEVFNPMWARKPEGVTKFLWVGGCAPAAAPDIVLQAYFRVFSDHDSVELTMVCNEAAARQLASEILYSTGYNFPQPAINFVQDNLSPHELAELYRNHSAVVLPLRFHGGCHPVTEAMASGTLLIATPWTAPLDYATENEALWIDYKLEYVDSAMERLNRYSCMAWFTNYYSRYQRDVRYVWAEPSVEHLAELMRKVYAGDYDGGIVDRALAKAKTLTWDGVAKNITDVMEKGQG